MAMQASLEQFKTAIIVLQQYSIQQINSNLQNMTSHQTLAEADHQNNMKGLRQILTRYKKVQSQMNYQKASVQTNFIQPWIPVVGSYQSTSVYKDSLTSSVNQVIQAKKQIGSLDNTLNELEIKVTRQAKMAKGTSDNLDKIQQQIYILQVAIDLNNFFINSGLNPKGIADFEIQKYYDEYMKG